MNQVTLYTTQKKLVQSYDKQNVPQYHYPPMQDLVPVRGSSVLLDKQEIQIDNLPIERFWWASDNGVYREVYAAFDRELLELIGCSQEKFKRDVNEAVDRRVKQDYSDLLAVKSTLETLESYSLWDRLCWSIKRIWEV